MTEQNAEHPIVHAQEFVPVAATATDRLAQLHAAYADAKAIHDDASQKLNTIKDAIKVELTTLAPEGSTKIALTGDDGPPLQLTYSERWTIDSRKLKREDPETYVRYAKKGGSWTLAAAKGGAPE